MAKADNLPQVGVGIIVLKKDGEKTYVMMHRRVETHGKNYWGTGGGHLRLGESLKAGALRELHEEAGKAIHVKNVRFMGVMNFTHFEPKHYVDISFQAEWVSGEPQNTEPEEVTDWQWFELGDLPKPLFPPVENYLKALETGQNFFDASFETNNVANAK